MDRELVARLTSGEGQALLDSLAGAEPGDALALSDRLRRQGFDAELVAAALTQAELRRKAVTKLGPEGARLLLTRDGLEQATRTVVAQEHARRFLAAGARALTDLGCGIGSDSLTFARAGLAVTAVEADAATAAIAAANLRGTGARVRHTRAEDVPLDPASGAWLDPARRTPGVADVAGRTRRTFRLEDLSPSWELVLDVASRVPMTGVKLSPLFPTSRIPDGAEAQWVSVGGEVVECTLWFGPLARDERRTALVLAGGSRHEILAAPAPPPRLPGLDTLPEHLYEPDAAVLAAGLVGALADAVGGHELDERVGLVASAFAVDVPWARRYTVLDAVPHQTKALKAALRNRGIGRATVKKRGVPADVDAVAKALRTDPRGPEGVVLLTRVQGRPVALLLRRDG